MKKPTKDNKKRRIKPVFFDPTSHRHVVVLFLFLAFGALVAFWGYSFSKAIYNAELPARTGILEAADGVRGDQQSIFPSSAWPERAEATTADPDTDWSPELPTNWNTQPADVYAFVPRFAQDALTSIRANIETIDVLLPEQFEVGSTQSHLVRLENAPLGEFDELLLGRGEQLRIFPVVRQALLEMSTGHPWLDTLPNRSAVVASALEIVRSGNLDGLCFNVTGLPEVQVAAVVAFMKSLDFELNSIGAESCLIGMLTDPLWRHPDARNLADHMIVIPFESPGDFSAPGPLAPQSDLDRDLNAFLDDFGPDNAVIALGSQGAEWISGQVRPNIIGFFDLMTQAVLNEATVSLDPASLNTTTTFTDAEGHLHQLWSLDVVSAYNTLIGLGERRPKGIAIWPIGSEDPGIWQMLTGTGDIAQLPAPTGTRFEGAGALMTIRIRAYDGMRRYSVDETTGRIVDMQYLQLPTAFTIQQHGALRPNEVALTFDDGPDPDYTPQLLDTLKEYEVPAAFFVIGSQVLEHPDIARRITAEGHEIGSHTYSHPHFDRVGPLRVKIELHITQELLNDVVAQNTYLFRAPYGVHDEPGETGQGDLLRILLEEGYVVVGTELDSKDWSTRDAQTILDTLMSSLHSNGGNVILMHDGGGDRFATVEALPNIIESFQSAGYTFVSLSDLLGADLVNPVTDAGQDPLSHFSFLGIRALDGWLTNIFFATILAGTFRSVLIVTLALRKHRRTHIPPDFSPAVTVALPAYCEESVIERTITSVLASDYEITEVIVVDDGSTDGTADRVRKAFGSHPKVRLVEQENQGKAEALNNACRLAKTPIVVAIDADTVIDPGAITKMVRHFRNPAVGAVAGNVKVGNRHNLLTKLQAIEYITAQNLDRRAYESINGIMVVPGAIGAWRIDAIDAAGGYTTETLVEDADLTIAIVRAGYHIAFEPDALAFTEAPETVRQLVRQRIRWTFGMLQVSWKHKGAFRERRTVGLVSIPDLMIFGILFSLFAPLADFVMVTNAVQVIYKWVTPQAGAVSSLSLVLLAAYIAYLLSDMLLGAIAMYLEPRENWWLLPVVLTQRFFYRQIFWFVVLRSVWRALTGRFMGWKKVARTGTVDTDDALAITSAKPREGA